jgi:hypothetical protein
MNDFLKEVARIKGIPYVEPPEPNRPSISEPTYTAKEIELLIGMRVNERMHGLRQEMINMIAGQTDRWVYRMIDDLRRQVAELQERLTKPIDPRAVLPDLKEMTKIRIQYWDNKTNRPPQHGRKRTTIANHLLKLYVWTCPKKDVSQYAEGNCGSFYMPMMPSSLAA